jgi:hypothetical protein
VSFRVRRYARRVFIAAALGLALTPTIGRAQNASLPSDTVTPLIAAAPAPSMSARRGTVQVDWAAEPPQPSSDSIADAVPSRRGVFVPLYVSFAALQALDVHSTMRALEAGATEQNPLLRGIASRPAALVALKAGVTASTILLTEKLRVRNRTGAIVLMTALNSVYAFVVARNYQAIR